MSGTGPQSSPATGLTAAGPTRRVVIVSPNAAEFVGGVERSCNLLASVLQARGAHVTLVWPRRDPGRWFYRAGLGSLSLSRQVAADPALASADLVVTNGIFGWGFGTRAPRIHIFHGTIVEMTRAEAAGLTSEERVAARLPRRELLRRRWGAGVAEALSGRHATIVCVSESTVEEIRRHYRLEADAIIANGINLDVFTPRPREQARAELGLAREGRLALFAGRLNFSKGGAFMQRACANAGYKLMVAGPTGAPGAVNLGSLTPSALALAYGAADCVLLPSLYEACSYVVLESLASGVPVLASRVGSIPSLLRSVPEYDALCLSPSEHELTAMLEYVRRVDTTAIVARARAWVVENNSLERYGERWNALLDTLEQRVPADPRTV